MKKERSDHMDEIRELLLRRGFTEEDIDTKFRAYISCEKEWRINSITPEAVAKATSVDELMPLFSKDSVDNRWGNPWGASGKDFASFVQKDVKPFEIPAGILEPHIAFLAAAVNEIGAFTTMSCDGWHDESFEQWGEHTMKLHMNERYSAMWLLLVMRQVFGECDNDGWDTWRFYDEDNAMPEYRNLNMLACRMSEGNELNIYEKNYRYALVMKENKDAFLEKRQDIISYLRVNKDFFERSGFERAYAKLEREFKDELNEFGESICNYMW